MVVLQFDASSGHCTAWHEASPACSVSVSAISELCPQKSGQRSQRVSTV